MRDFVESPVLPTGYAGMIVLALIPPLWRRVMDPRVVAHFDGDISRANIQPGKRAKVLARDGASNVTGVGNLPEVVTADTLGDATDGGMCPGCGYVYGEKLGDPREGLPAGTPWSAIPDSWCCPDCGVREKIDLVAPGRVGA